MRKYFVAFIDILGYSSMVKKDCQDASRSFANLAKLESVIKEFPNVIDGSSIDITQFSDCIVLAAPYDPDSLRIFLQHCCALQKKLLDNRILCRGGVSYGDHYKSKDFLFSEGLITAYHLESNVAKYPRIIISDDLLELFNFTNRRNKSKSLEIKEMLVLERTGEYFLDYLTDIDLSEAVEIGEYYRQQLNFASSLSTKEKMLWVLDYINAKYPGCIKYENERFTYF